MRKVIRGTPKTGNISGGFITIDDGKGGKRVIKTSGSAPAQTGKIMRRGMERQSFGGVSRAVMVAARATERIQFLTGFISGHRGVKVNFHKGTGFSALEKRQVVDIKRKRYGVMDYNPELLMKDPGRYILNVIREVNLPRFSNYTQPLSPGNTWRVYRSGLGHEAWHLRYTPNNLYEDKDKIPGLSSQTTHMMLNIIEDRRIEDLGTAYHTGLASSRIFSNAFALYRRPSASEQISAEAQLMEAFLQRVIVGEIKDEHTLDPAYRDCVHDAAEYVEAEFAELEGSKDDRTGRELFRIASYAAELLRLTNPPEPQDPDTEKKMDENKEKQGEQQKQDKGKKEKGGSPGYPGGPSDPDEEEDEDEDFDPLEGIKPQQTGDPELDKNLPDENEPKAEDGEVDVDIEDYDESTFRGGGDSPEEQAEAEKRIKEYLKKLKEKAERKEQGESKEGEENQPIPKSDDIDDADEPTGDALKEWQDLNSPIGGKEKEIAEHFMPCPDIGDPSKYRDRKITRKLSGLVEDWQQGREAHIKRSGSTLSVPTALGTEFKKPFKDMRKTGVRGQKYLFVMDFSSSVGDEMADAFKKAGITTSEILQDVDAEVAMFGFGGVPIAGQYENGVFKIKSFEEGDWKRSHSGKLALIAPTFDYTPTGQVYQNLEKYIKRHNPEYVITVTDGAPSSNVTDIVKKLKKNTRMVAFGIGWSKGNAEDVKKNLDRFEYDDTFALSKDELDKFPTAIVDLIDPMNVQ